MAEVRCPMCGKPNPPDLDICQFCEARLVPLVPGAPMEDPEPAGGYPPEPAGEDDPGEGWLDDLRSEEDDEYAFQDDEPDPDSQDWLGRISPEAPLWTPEPAGDEPPAVERPEPEATIDWTEPAYEGESHETRDIPGMTFSSQAQEEEEDLPEWLKSLEAGPPGEASPPPGAPSEPTGSEEGESPAGQDTIEIPGLSFRPAQEDLAGQRSEPAGADETAAEPGMLPDWLSGQAESFAEDSAGSEGTPDWLLEDSDAVSGDMPDWLAGEEQPDQPAASTAASGPDMPEEPWIGAGDESEGLPDWMQEEPEAEAGSTGRPAWLAAEAAAEPGLEPAATPAGEGEPPDWMEEEPEAESGELPDWMQAGAAAAALVAAAGALSGEAGETESLSDASPWQEEADAFDWMGEEETGGSEEPGDRMAAEAAAEIGSVSAVTPEGEAEPPDWMEEEPEAEAGDLPDWLKAGAAAAALGAAASVLSGEEEAEETRLDASAETEEELPDWLKTEPGDEAWDLERESRPAEEFGEPVPPFGAEGAGQVVPGWLDSEETEEPAIPAPGMEESEDWIETGEGRLEPGMPLSLEEEDVPDWLKSLQSAQQEAAIGAEVESLDSLEVPAEDSAEMVEEGEIPDWLEELSFTVPAIAVEAGGGGEFPAPEAPRDAVEDELTGEESAEIEPILPGVLQDAFAESEEMEISSAEAEGEEDLAPADLPGWLKAMRPVEAVAAVSPFVGEGEVGQSIEGVGPLAGLQGVLPAEPEITHAGSSSIGSMRVDVTKNQYDHVSLLKSIVKEEVEPRQYEEKRSLIQPGHILRWVIAAALIAFLTLPLLTGGSGASQPTFLPDETLAANQAISLLQPGQKVLVAFDYQPGLSGEMNAIADPVFQDLLGRQVLLTIVSTNPTGPALAEAFLAEDGPAGNFSYVHGENYLNLGYIPGGAAGLQFFALNPQAVLPVPFNLTGFSDDPYSAWTKPPLQGVAALADFALALVITDDAGVARAWVEQAAPSFSGTPLLMIASGQAAPLVRPYYETAPRQVDGLVSGLMGGISYQQFAQGTTLAADYWDAYNNGILIAIVLIIGGGMYGTLASLLRQSRQGSEPESKPEPAGPGPEVEA